MFIQNKYTKIYFNLIENSKIREIPEVYEKHHIIPKSFGGSDDIENIALLSPREHYIAHRLLVKMCEGEMKMKMSFALHTFFHFNKFRKLKFTSHQYHHHKLSFKDACKNRSPWTKSDIFMLKHRKSGIVFKGTRREFIEYSGLTEQECNFLWKAATNPDSPTRWIKNWGVWVAEMNDWSYNKVRKPQALIDKVCEHCGKKVSPGNYKRWHGDNCRIIDSEGHYERTRQVASINSD